MIIDEKTAMEIADEASKLMLFSVLDSTGYYTVYSNDSRKVNCAVDVCKTDDLGCQYYSIFVDYEGLDHNGKEIQSYWVNTDHLDKDELIDTILEVAEAAKKLYGNCRKEKSYEEMVCC